MSPAPPQEFETCLGDLYSVAWLEDSEIHNLNKETLEDQYEMVSIRDPASLSFHFLQFPVDVLELSRVSDTQNCSPGWTTARLDLMELLVLTRLHDGGPLFSKSHPARSACDTGLAYRNECAHLSKGGVRIRVLASGGSITCLSNSVLDSMFHADEVPYWFC
jgi:hypothetical protein